MPMLPVPAFVALVLAWLAVRTVLSGGRRLLVLLLAACAWQSLAVALVSGYGAEALRPVLPVTATLIPPLAWMTFRDALYPQPERAALHAAAPLFTLFCVLFAPVTLDVVVPGVFVAYGTAILVLLRRATDVPLASLEAGEMPARLWRVLGWALILSAFTDILIAGAILAGLTAWTGWIVTVFSSGALLALELLSANPSARGIEDRRAEDAPPPGPAPEDIAEDAAIVARLDALLEREALHLDPNLTLVRLARRLRLPEKRLSAAVNRATGGNVSRHINDRRIRHACASTRERGSRTPCSTADSTRSRTSTASSGAS